MLGNRPALEELESKLRESIESDPDIFLQPAERLTLHHPDSYFQQECEKWLESFDPFEGPLELSRQTPRPLSNPNNTLPVVPRPASLPTPQVQGIMPYLPHPVAIRPQLSSNAAQLQPERPQMYRSIVPVTNHSGSRVNRFYLPSGISNVANVIPIDNIENSSQQRNKRKKKQPSQADLLAAQQRVAAHVAQRYPRRLE